MPTPNELKPYQGFPLQSVVELAIKYLPFLGFFLIWAAVQFKDLLKGDFTDRSQVRKKEREDAAYATQQQREDDKILGLQKMIINNSDEGAPVWNASPTCSMRHGCKVCESGAETRSHCACLCPLMMICVRACMHAVPMRSCTVCIEPSLIQA